MSQIRCTFIFQFEDGSLSDSLIEEHLLDKVPVVGTYFDLNNQKYWIKQVIQKGNTGKKFIVYYR